MFSKATARFVRQIDPDGSLIHVSRVNDSHKLLPMAIVVKRNRFWAWQRPKYHPTDFTLSDLLQGGKALKPGVSEAEFLTYQGTFGDEYTGKLDTEAGPGSVSVEGLGRSKLQSCFGKLKKEELDVKKLLKDSNNRLVDMQHVLVQQMEKRAEVLTVVKERILTTNSCSVSQTQKQQCTFQGVLRLLGLPGSSVKVLSGKEVNTVQLDCDVSLEIPSGTVIAYSILELEIKKTGHYDICLQPGTIGGFENDSVSMSRSCDDSLTTVDGIFNGDTVQGAALWRSHQNESQYMDLSPLGNLPQSVRLALSKKLQETLRDRAALSYLQCLLEELCSSERVQTDVTDEPQEVLRNSVILDQLDSDCLSECSQSVVPAQLSSIYLLVSAMEELPDETLSLLSDSRPDFLASFDKLMVWLQESSTPLSMQSIPVALQDSQFFQQAEQLLSSINVMLRTDTDQLWMETGDSRDVLLLVLSLSVFGLSLLCASLHE
ncbi:gasdermin-E-like [Nematolebias whitei]|uniref:gasdermin-E-like n=1 Tax=Nematolebias whitei TaxID=451745 RepID=UPI001899B6A0|nr:gasdermin-E-like [Nematolebias whitei]